MLVQISKQVLTPQPCEISQPACIRRRSFTSQHLRNLELLLLKILLCKLSIKIRPKTKMMMMLERLHVEGVVIQFLLPHQSSYFLDHCVLFRQTVKESQVFFSLTLV